MKKNKNKNTTKNKTLKTYRDSYRYIGQVIQFTNSEDIADGTIGLLLEHDTDCDTYYDLYNETVEAVCDEYDFTLIQTPASERIELMYEGITTQILQLIAEGWEIDGDIMNLTPYITRQKILKMLIDGVKIEA